MKKKQKKAKPRGYRNSPQEPFVFSKNFPEGFDMVEDKTFVTHAEYKKLEKKYKWVVARYKRNLL